MYVISSVQCAILDLSFVAAYIKKKMRLELINSVTDDDCSRIWLTSDFEIYKIEI